MLSRRELMRFLTAGALGSGAAALGCGQRGPSQPPVDDLSPDFTIAFLTDPHVDGEKSAPEGSTRAFEHAMAQARPPELVITGGDLVFDILEVDRTAADQQFELFDQAMSAVAVPIFHTLGNHDCFGVHEKSGVSSDDPLFGKEYFLQHFGLERAYYSFDHEGWHFVVLDTIGIEGHHYRGWVDEEQIAWLDDDLAAASKPTVVIGHVPLFSNYIEWKRGTAEGIPPYLSVVNAHQVAEVLVKHPVKLVLAGHLHINEVFIYKGIEFANVGAVSGNWWQGPRDGFEEGYAVLELRGEQVSWRYVDYGWEAVTAG